MPSWKKLLQSGSSADLLQITASKGLISDNVDGGDAKFIIANSNPDSDMDKSSGVYFKHAFNGDSSDLRDAGAIKATKLSLYSINDTTALSAVRLFSGGGAVGDVQRMMMYGTNLETATRVGIGFSESDTSLPTVGLSVKGNISASGIVYATNFLSSSVAGDLPVDGNLKVGGYIWASGSNSHITASGNISASGTINVNRYDLQGNKFADIGTTGTFNIGQSGGSSLNLNHITASGNISASATGSFGHLMVDGGNFTSASLASAIAGTGGSGGGGIFKPTGSIKATTNNLQITGSVTVSGSSTFTNIGTFENTGSIFNAGTLNNHGSTILKTNAGVDDGRLRGTLVVNAKIQPSDYRTPIVEFGINGQRQYQFARTTGGIIPIGLSSFGNNHFPYERASAGSSNILVDSKNQPVPAGGLNIFNSFAGSPLTSSAHMVFWNVYSSSEGIVSESIGVIGYGGSGPVFGFGTTQPSASFHITASLTGSQTDLIRVQNDIGVPVFKMKPDGRFIMRNSGSSANEVTMSVDSANNFVVNDTFKVNHKDVRFKSGSQEVSAKVDPSTGQINFEASDGAVIGFKGAETEIKTADGKITKKVVQDGKEFLRSGSATENQIEFEQNPNGSFITVSGSVPGFNVIKSGASNEFQIIRQTYNTMYAGGEVYTYGMDSTDKMWFINNSILADASDSSLFRMSSSGDLSIKRNISASGTIIGSNISGTNTGDVTLAGSLDYLTISGQEITRNEIHIVTDTNLNVSDTTGQTGIDLTLGSLNGRLTAVASGLDTDDDVQFNHITSSGDISSSGTITGNELKIGSATTEIGADDSTINRDLSVGRTLSLASELVHTGDIGTNIAFTTGKIESTATNISFVGTVTASGNISSSGTIIGSNISGTNTGDQDLSTYIQNSQTGSFVVNSQTGSFLTSIPDGTYSSSLQTLGNITASGDISASGTVVGSNLSGTNTGDQSLVHLAVTASDVTFNNITASGDVRLLDGGTLQIDGGDVIRFNDDNNFKIAGLPLGSDRGIMQFNSGHTSQNILEIHHSASLSAVLIGKTSAVHPPSTLTVQGDISGSGNLDVDGNVSVDGALTATRKSFLIPHPTKQDKQLQYASLEGPENGVYIRGKLKGDNIIELPDYWTELIDKDSITVSLTPIGNSQYLYVKDISTKQIMVGINDKPVRRIYCHYVVYAERKDIDKLEVEI